MLAREGTAGGAEAMDQFYSPLVATEKTRKKGALPLLVAAASGTARHR